jgi:hypothetical protein
LYVFVSPLFFGPEGVDAVDRTLSREALRSVFAGATACSGDVLLSYDNEKTRDILSEKILQEA